MTSEPVHARPRKSPQASPQQRAASDPRTSAWVTASAGSGKTTVLVDRVLRLMLAGAAPERILCLTFTKAAASEMAGKLLERLGGWIGLPDDDLTERLGALGVSPVTSETRALARRLFTRALETPGGLKIQTLHGFCERLLQMFPVEAGVVPGFRVLEGDEAAALLLSTMNEGLSRARLMTGTPEAHALDLVASLTDQASLALLLQSLFREAPTLAHILNAPGGLEAASAALEAEGGLTPGLTRDDIGQRMVESFTQVLTPWKTALTRCKGNGFTQGLMAALDRAPDPATLMELFFTKECEPRKSLLPKADQKAEPGLYEAVLALQIRLEDYAGQRQMIRTREATHGLLVLGKLCLETYEARKRQMGACDFDDLILRTRALLTEKSAAAWVLYKLDSGLDHILVDEAQDTSAAQWDIVRALTDEFFAGEGSGGKRVRTLFAVGDRKQSIYSFQGADPEAFDAARADFTHRLKAMGQTLALVPLTVSYRSTQAVLDLVDKVFETPGVWGAMPDPYEGHTAQRAGQVGLAEVWPRIPALKAPKNDPWTAPSARIRRNHRRVELGALVASLIAQWLREGRQIEALGRPVTAGDILVLTRNRTEFTPALMRELRRFGVSVAGADRLKLARELAVLDLVSLARFSLVAGDDLSLAEVLKSPLCGLDDDALMQIAAGRGAASLWSVIAASTDPALAQVRTLLENWRIMAQALAPADFFDQVLETGSPSGRQRFRGRMGPESDDGLDAFIARARDFEAAHGPSLTGFLEAFLAGTSEIKRDFERAGGEVRIMTVHGAKGLEAPIVILADVSEPIHGSTRPGLLLFDHAGQRWPLWKIPGKPVPAAVAAAIAAQDVRDLEEYRRLLYVAMTRARDALYVFGTEDTGHADSWHRLVAGGIEKLGVEDEQGVWRWTSGTVRGDAEGDKGVSGEPVSVPDWAQTPPEPEPEFGDMSGHDDGPPDYSEHPDSPELDDRIRDF